MLIPVKRLRIPPMAETSPEGVTRRERVMRWKEPEAAKTRTDTTFLRSVLKQESRLVSFNSTSSNSWRVNLLSICEKRGMLPWLSDQANDN